jgi:hypothetical protein
MPANQVELLSHGRGMASDYDFRFTVYPATTDGNVAVMFDPKLERTFYSSDAGENGSYSLDDNIYYQSIEMKDSSGNSVGDPTTVSGTSDVFVHVTRRNGWVYKLQLCPTELATGEYISKLVKITNPQGFSTDLTYKTFTQTQINSSPSRQLQIDTVTDSYGNVAQVTYNSSQQSGQ